MIQIVIVIYLIVKTKKKENNFNNDIISEDFIKSLNKLNKKNKNATLKILYSSSFTRLFIGETDIDSIRERYLSNIDTKKEQKLEKNNKYYTLSGAYLKMFLNRVIQDQKNNVPLMEKNLETLLNKFKKNQELIDRFKRINIDTEKLYHNDLMTSKNENTFQRINTTSKLEMRPNNTIKSAHSTDIYNYTYTNIEKNTNLLNSFSKKHLNHELAKTPEIIKCKLSSNDNKYLKQESIKKNENKKISRFNFFSPLLLSFLVFISFIIFSNCFSDFISEIIKLILL